MTISDNRISLLKVEDIIRLTVYAENQFIRDTIEAAALARKKMCEFDSLSTEIEAELKEGGFKVNRVEMMGGQVITVKWA